MSNSTHPLIILARLAMGLGVGVVLIAYVAICLHAGNPWPWMMAVHEDGVRTLLDTLLYYEHATRELPQDLLLGAAIGASAYAAFPAMPGAQKSHLPTLALAAVVAVILGGAIVQTGLTSVIENLLQNHTRPGAPLAWGSHWRYHLLERGPLIAACLGIAVVARAGFNPSVGPLDRRGVAVVLAMIAGYVALTVLFTPSRADLALPFCDPQYLGHAAREIMTHVVVTLPIGWGGCILLCRSQLPPSGVNPPRAWTGGLLRSAPWILGAGLVWTYVLVASLRADAASHGQSADWTILIFPHFFEHGFTYLVVPLTAAVTYSLCAPRKPGA
jgi:hypothetical protein